jgi:uncharacterized membrane protein YeiB
MNQPSLTDPAPNVEPIRSSERIQALDVVRGFALIGIFLMNIEFFNRPLSSIALGLPVDVGGADHWAGWFIYTFVQGKFWTMFSFLFGMGFAVMLTRAERAGRNFLRPYLRRIAALAVFGLLHHIFLWGGDILFSYSVGATGLLLLLWGDWKWLLGAFVALGALCLLGMGDWFFPTLIGIALISLAALFLRWDAALPWFHRRAPVIAIILQLVGVIVLAVATVLWTTQWQVQARWLTTIGGVLLLSLGLLAARYRDPPEARARRLGATMYLVPFLVMFLAALTAVGAPQRASDASILASAPADVAARAIAKAQAANADANLPASLAKANARSAAPVAKTSEKAATAEPSPVEQAAQRSVDRAGRASDLIGKIDEERVLLTTGSYMDNVRLRASDFAENAPSEPLFSMVIIGMFLLGSWFVRSGVMEDTGAHLALFRRLVLYALPLGLAMGLVGNAIGTHASPGMERDPYQIGVGLTMLGNLPACLGYVGILVLMLHSATVFARIRVFAPLGRMALTNYLTHSIVGTLYFYHYGLGNYGMGRARQVLFVLVVIGLQLVFCHWWLSRFRYGPMEWLWRAITYWQLPPMRREAPAVLAGSAAA